MIRPQDSDHGGQPPFDPRSLLLHMERSRREVPPGDIGESQECYYDAMEAPTDDEEHELLARAQELDPGNTDAWLIMMNHFEPLSVEEEIETMRKLVEVAEERLGKHAFKEFAGHFWGFHETRPYMRARAAYADALHRAGRIESSVAEVESMLELNPGDNQGLRYRLLACHLALGKLDDVRRLFERYPDEFDFNTVFAWGKVLERYLAGKPQEALKSITNAQKQNPSSKAYILGHRRLPKNPPDSYSPGSKEEAAVFAADLQTAWNAHPLAKKWLAANSGKK